MAYLNNSSQFQVAGLNFTNFPNLSSAKTAELTAWMATTLTISLLGSVNSLALIVTLCSRHNRKSGFNLQITHFAILNLFMCLAGVPSSVFLVMAKRDGYFIRPGICDFLHPPAIVGSTLVNWADAGLAVNRCIALYFPHKYRAWSRSRVNLGMIVGYWIICIVAVLPFPLKLGGSKMILTALGLCALAPAGAFSVFLSAMISYVPYAVAGSGALLILLKTLTVGRERRRVVHSLGEDQRYRAIQRRLGLAKLLVVSLLWNSLCATPTFVIGVNFPRLFATNPVTTLWMRTSSLCQFAFTPVE